MTTAAEQTFATAIQLPPRYQLRAILKETATTCVYRVFDVADQQDEAIKILTVVSVAGVPPVLVAGVYGMNFDYLPELKWHYGYIFALGSMLASAVLPYWFFRVKGWL